MKFKSLNPWNWVEHEQTSTKKNGEEKNTNLVNQEPLSSYPIMRLHQDIDRLFNEAFQSFNMPSMFSHSLFNDSMELFKPSINIEAVENNYTITLEVPGVDENQVELDIANDTLIIKGEKSDTQKKDDKEYHHIERSYGNFERVLSLPEDADQKNVEANFKDGILSITLKRKQVSKAEVRHINIKRAG